MTMLRGQRKLRISEPLARLDGKRQGLSDQLIELEITKRVCARFGWIAVSTEERGKALLGEDCAGSPVTIAEIEAVSEPLGCVVGHYGTARDLPFAMHKCRPRARNSPNRADFETRG
jgi:hypothetical protein